MPRKRVEAVIPFTYELSCSDPNRERVVWHGNEAGLPPFLLGPLFSSSFPLSVVAALPAAATAAAVMEITVDPGDK